MPYNITPKAFIRIIIAIIVALYGTVGCYLLGSTDADAVKSNHFLVIWFSGVIMSIFIALALFIALVILALVMDWIFGD